jgi:hypothetical protein
MRLVILIASSFKHYQPSSGITIGYKNEKENMGKIFLGVFIGAAIAGAIYYYYNQDDVKEQLDNLKDKASDALGKAKDAISKTKNTVENMNV